VSKKVEKTAAMIKLIPSEINSRVILHRPKRKLKTITSGSGAQPALHFGGGNFHEFAFDDVIVFIQP